MAGAACCSAPFEAIVVSSGVTPPVARDGYARTRALLVSGVGVPEPRAGGLNQVAGRCRAQNRATRLQNAFTACSTNPGLSALATVIAPPPNRPNTRRSEEPTSDLQAQMTISYADFSLK